MVQRCVIPRDDGARERLTYAECVDTKRSMSGVEVRLARQHLLMLFSWTRASRCSRQVAETG